MEKIELKAEPRTSRGKQVKTLRRQGLVPAIMYGHRTDPVCLQVEAPELDRVLARAGGSRLITLTIGGSKGTHMALAREVQRDAITGSPLHVDFYEVTMTEKIRVEVPVVLVGESPVVARGEGMLLHMLDTIEIECLPGDLLDRIEVDVSGLDEFDKAIYVRDLNVPASIELVSEGDEMIVKVEPLGVEEEEVAVEAVPAEVEVITERKAKKEVEQA
ncbi:MAG: 50S ribosomal protein L25 [Anaerolineae bacterium]|nr:50S ribosomal protein L25 [Anaerolineae bacterium]MDH7472576.1 50S ribosomal protein L25 [Anaerolineae bacterium]